MKNQFTKNIPTNEQGVKAHPPSISPDQLMIALDNEGRKGAKA
jgi:hypothetical protein